MVKIGNTVRLKAATLERAKTLLSQRLSAIGLTRDDTGVVRHGTGVWRSVYFWRLRESHVLHCDWLEKVDV